MYSVIIISHEFHFIIDGNSLANTLDVSFYLCACPSGNLLDILRQTVGVSSLSHAFASGSSNERGVEDDRSLGGQSGVSSLVLDRQSTSSKFSPHFASVGVHHPPPKFPSHRRLMSPQLRIIHPLISPPVFSCPLLILPQFLFILPLVFPLWVASLCHLTSPHLVMF